MRRSWGESPVATARPSQVPTSDEAPNLTPIWGPPNPNPHVTMSACIGPDSDIEVYWASRAWHKKASDPTYIHSLFLTSISLSCYKFLPSQSLKFDRSDTFRALVPKPPRALNITEQSMSSISSMYAYLNAKAFVV